MAKLKVNDAVINYELDGEAKETIVLLNGIMMSTNSWEEYVEPITEAGYQLLRLDFRDQGASSKCEEQYGLRQQLEDLKAVLDKLDLDQVHLAGISYGGMVALLFALNYEKKLSSLLLYNTPARATRRLQEVSDGWEEAAKFNDGEKFCQLAFPHIYSTQFYEKYGDWLKERQKQLDQVLDKEWFEGFTRLSISGKNFDFRGDLGELTVPTLLAAGDSDTIISVSDVRELKEEIPEARMVVFTDCGHASCYESKEEFLTTLLGFTCLH